MRSLLALLMMLAAGLALAALLSGTAGLPDPMLARRLLPEQLHGHSFALGAAAGLVLAHVLRVSWRDLPQRALAWAFSNRRRFRLLGYGGAFLAVLFLY